jgi:hypothetical protein
MALGNIGAMTVQLLGDINKFKRDMDNAGGKVKGFGTTVSQVGKKIASAGKAMTAAITLPLIGFGVAAIKFASDAEEIQSKFDAVFKEFAEQTSVWVEEFADAVNRNATDLKDYAATFQDTFVPLGFVREEAAELSKALVELTIDLASFNNASEPETMRALQSAIVGNHETVRRFGVIINQAALEQELLNMGIRDGAEAATEAEKAQARLNLIIAGTTDAQGDAIRTSESFANQMKGLKGELKEVSEQIGTILIPMLAPLIEQIKKLMDAFNSLDEAQKERIVKLLIAIAALGPAVMIVGNLTAAFGALWATALGPAGIAFGALLVGIEALGGVEAVYNVIQGAAQDARDAIFSVNEEIASGEAAIDSFANTMSFVSEKLAEYASNAAKNRSDYIKILDTLREAQQKAIEDFREGADFSDVILVFKETISDTLFEMGILGEDAQVIFDRLDEMIATFSGTLEDMAAAFEETERAADSSNIVFTTFNSAVGSTMTPLRDFITMQGEAGDAAAQMAADVALAADLFEQAQTDAMNAVFAKLQELKTVYEEIEASIDQFWENAQDAAATALVDMIKDFGTFRSTREAEEEAHQEELQRIRDTHGGLSTSELNKLLDAQEQLYKDTRTTIGGILRDMFGDFVTFLADELWALAAATLVKSIAAFIALNPVEGTALGLSAARLGVGALAVSVLASSIPGFEEGGIVPGPAGAAVPAIVHAGEEVLTVEQQAARAIDYEKMAEAVMAGTYEAMKDIASEGSTGVVAQNPLTKMAQLLYDPLQREGVRRGAPA